MRTFLLPFLFVAALRAAAPCEIDCRADFEAAAYSGLAIDSFASADLNTYLNPGASGAVRERAIAGFQFEYRVAGDQQSPDRQQLWVFGQTEHGLRSADIDCSQAGNSTLPVCASNPVAQPAANFVYMLRNASSLEAFTGVRWEFPAIQRTGGHAARPYLKAQFAFLTVAGSGAGAIGLQQLAVGLTATAGPFLHSRLEAGFGRTGLFLREPNRRLKVDGYLEWDSKVFRAVKARPFVELKVDSDLGPGADSIQTYLGLAFDLDKIF